MSKHHMTKPINHLLVVPLLLVTTTLWAGQLVANQTNGIKPPVAPTLVAPAPAAPAPAASTPVVPSPVAPALVVPAPGQQAPAQPESKPWGLSLSDFLNHDEQDMLFDYLREAFVATIFNLEDASMPPELAFKLAILRQRAIREGDAAVQQLMQALQKEVDRAMREYQVQQPPQPTAPAGPNRP